jgi:hypothetical protein
MPHESELELAGGDVAKFTGYTSVQGLNRALRSLPREAAAELRDASQTIADEVAGAARGRALATGGAYQLVGMTIKSRRDRVPVVQLGGSSRIPGRSGPRQTVGDLIWGAEYGGGARPRTRQFRPWLGSDDGAGYALWPTVRELNPEIRRLYSEALRTALERI